MAHVRVEIDDPRVGWPTLGPFWPKLAILAAKRQSTSLKKHRLLTISVLELTDPLFIWLIVALVRNGHCQGRLDVVALLLMISRCDVWCDVSWEVNCQIVSRYFIGSTDLFFHCTVWKLKENVDRVLCYLCYLNISMLPMLPRRGSIGSIEIWGSIENHKSRLFWYVSMLPMLPMLPNRTFFGFVSNGHDWPEFAGIPIGKKKSGRIFCYRSITFHMRSNHC